MSRIRITCKAKPQEHAPQGSQFPVILGSIPSFDDVEVALVDDDGAERSIHNVSSVSFSVREGEIATATLTFLDVEVDLDAEADLPPTRPEALR